MTTSLKSPRKYTVEDLKDISDVLDLSVAEQKILACAASGIAKTFSQLSKCSGVPRGSIPHIIKNLERRKLIEGGKTKALYTTYRGAHKMVWMSNMLKIAQKLRYAASSIDCGRGIMCPLESTDD